jgi:hypothetical protein
MQIGVSRYLRVPRIRPRRNKPEYAPSTTSTNRFRYCAEKSMPQTNTDLAESLHQFVTIWKMIGRPFPGVDQTDRAGLAITWLDTHFPFYNALFLTEQVVDAPVLQDRVQEAAAYMRARPNGGLFVVCLDNVGGAAKESLPTIQRRLPLSLPGGNDARSTAQRVWGSGGATCPKDGVRNDPNQ